MAKKKQEGTTPVVLTLLERTTPRYLALELRDFDGRLGAMDAYYLPSRVGSRRIYPRGGKV